MPFLSCQVLICIIWFWFQLKIMASKNSTSNTQRGQNFGGCVKPRCLPNLDKNVQGDFLYPKTIETTGFKQLSTCVKSFLKVTLVQSAKCRCCYFLFFHFLVKICRRLSTYVIAFLLKLKQYFWKDSISNLSPIRHNQIRGKNWS